MINRVYKKQPKLQHQFTAIRYASKKWHGDGSLRKTIKFKMALTAARRKKRIQKLEEQGGKCFYCGMGLNEHTSTYDHIIPLSENGSEHYENFVVACKTCNSVRQSIPFEIFCNVVTSPQERREFSKIKKQYKYKEKPKKCDMSLDELEEKKRKIIRNRNKERKIADICSIIKRLREKYTKNNNNNKRLNELGHIRNKLLKYLNKIQKQKRPHKNKK